MKNYRILTITHKTANINHVGKYIPNVNDDSVLLAQRLHGIKKELQLDELLYLATCNRLMFFVVADVQLDDAFVMRFFSMLHDGVPEHCLLGILDIVARHSGEACVRHLFEVASSLDSLVVGEREILRQLRGAYDFCNAEGLTGDNIRIAMKAAIPLAKEVYTRTKIGENSVSVVSLAMQQMMNLKPQKDSRVVLVGAGQTNQLVAKYLLKNGFSNFVVYNRSLPNAELLANKLGGAGRELHRLGEHVEKFDILISCTGASDAIITPGLYAKMLGGDKTEKILIDLAVPNDIHPDILGQHNTRYIAVHNLRDLAERNMELRKGEVAKARHIIDERLEEFRQIVRQRKVERAMSGVPGKVKEIKQRAINGVFQKEIAEMDEHSKAVLEKVICYMEKKYISIPMAMARDIMTQPDLYEI